MDPDTLTRAHELDEQTDRRRPQADVLHEIADEIAETHPLHAQWLRNIADDRRGR